jgi:hypothetical protein
VDRNTLLSCRPGVQWIEAKDHNDWWLRWFRALREYHVKRCILSYDLRCDESRKKKAYASTMNIYSTKNETRVHFISSTSLRYKAYKEKNRKAVRCILTLVFLNCFGVLSNIEETWLANAPGNWGAIWFQLASHVYRKRMLDRVKIDAIYNTGTIYSWLYIYCRGSHINIDRLECIKCTAAKMTGRYIEGNNHLKIIGVDYTVQKIAAA